MYLITKKVYLVFYDSNDFHKSESTKSDMRDREKDINIQKKREKK